MKSPKIRSRRAPAWRNEVEIGGGDIVGDVHEARRLRIAAAAAETIAQHGLDSASLKNIAKKIGFTTGVIQYYFDKKEELLEFTKNHYIRELINEAVEAHRRAKGAKRLHTLCEMILPLTPERRQIWELLIAFNGGVIGDGAMMRAQSDQYRKSLEIFSRAIAERRNTDPARCLPDALGLVSLIEGLSYHIVFSSDGYAAAKPMRLVANYIDAVIPPAPARNPAVDEITAR